MGSRDDTNNAPNRARCCAGNSCCESPLCLCKPPSAFVGQKAPNFKSEAVLQDGSFRSLDLRSYEGRNVLLFFYPSDFTFVCPSEILALDRQIKEFNDRKTSVLGCSVDSKFSHQAWRNMEPKNGGIGRIQYPLLSDLTKTIARDYGVLTEDGVALRGLFVIDRNGVLQHSLINNRPIGRSVDEALRVIDAMLFHEANGDVCPANWKKGSKAMRPTAEGVAEYLGQLE